MTAILDALTVYYGLDWVALILGISGSYMITEQNRYGFVLTALACLCGFAVAVLSSQFGYVIYNVLLAAIAVRGFSNLSRYQRGTAEPAE
ncbi:MAG: hypothetical protein HYS17_02910 [Micavibrio aeruginosavorus]|uniref:Nicotinamide riboside transporter PnuC n=1 Tax=Micavibrio aeruginosavorus TaxID=349221 RepID=A0A7T5R3A8_9BACT|nr:MAG: hypothetical protein HYS17_02910 [Micavibrio aeruginosavorus]